MRCARTFDATRATTSRICLFYLRAGESRNVKTSFAFLQATDWILSARTKSLDSRSCSAEGDKQKNLLRASLNTNGSSARLLIRIATNLSIGKLRIY